MNRQLYQMGGMGIESLSPMQPAMQPAMYNPLEENYYSGMPMMMAGGGIANLVEREKYGIGSSLKKFVRNIIPNEVAKVASIAAPFVAPFNPLLAAGIAWEATPKDLVLILIFGNAIVICLCTGIGNWIWL